VATLSTEGCPEQQGHDLDIALASLHRSRDPSPRVAWSLRREVGDDAVRADIDERDLGLEGRMRDEAGPVFRLDLRRSRPGLIQHARDVAVVLDQRSTLARHRHRGRDVRIGRVDATAPVDFETLNRCRSRGGAVRHHPGEAPLNDYPHNTGSIGRTPGPSRSESRAVPGRPRDRPVEHSAQSCVGPVDRSPGDFRPIIDRPM
jgi:hypothetical protein